MSDLTQTCLVTLDIERSKFTQNFFNACEKIQINSKSLFLHYNSAFLFQTDDEEEVEADLGRDGKVAEVAHVKLRGDLRGHGS
jgi:hypothetical protein